MIKNIIFANVISKEVSSLFEERRHDGGGHGDLEGGEGEAPLVGEEGALCLQAPIELLLVVVDKD